MTEHTHTPAPWEAYEQGCEADNSLGVFYIHANGDSLPYTSANLWLIDAAPDLLAACEIIIKIVDDPWHDAIPTWSGVFDAARAAIAKARSAEPDHDPPDSRNHMAKPYDDALIGHLRNNPPRNE